MIHLLGGTITYRSEHGWQMDYYDHEDRNGPTGNIFRVFAAYLLWKYEWKKIICVGGKGYYEKMNAPSIAQIMWQDLHNLGVPADELDMLSEGDNTLGQLKACMPCEEILSSRWHLPRISLFMAHNKWEANLISAEDVILQYAPYWEPIIEHYSKGLSKRLDKEIEGINECLCGNYGKA